jgi:two-component system chemotaxis response regulator CheB
MPDSTPVIAVGASAGGLVPLRDLLAQLGGGLPAAVLVVQHLGLGTPAHLPSLLASETPLPVAFAQDKEPITPGVVRVAPPDHHLYVHGNHLRVRRGPRENLSRPSLDVLLRSAAVHRPGRVAGVVLSGLLFDGGMGLAAVRRCAGTALVQTPRDAICSSMPEHALRVAGADLVGAPRELGAFLGSWARRPFPAASLAVPDDLLIEAALAERVAAPASEGTAHLDPFQALDTIGKRAAYGCPECGGPLWEIEDENREATRYRCHAGHAYVLASLNEEQRGAAERALWVALRALEERTRMLDQMYHNALVKEHAHVAVSYKDRGREARQHTEDVRRLIASLTPDLPEMEAGDGTAGREPELSATNGPSAAESVARS